MASDDFTVRLTQRELEDYRDRIADKSRGTLKESLTALLGSGNENGPSTFRYSGQILIKPTEGVAAVYRALICRCDDHTGYSATFRKLGKGTQTGAHSLPPLMVQAPIERSKATPWPLTSYRHQDKILPKQPGGRLFGVQHVVDALWGQIAAASDQQRANSAAPLSEGLVVIAGRTGTAKNRIAEGIIDCYLKGCVSQNPERRPHLLTLQDPIENRFAEAGAGVGCGLIDYTPRARLTDYDSIDDAVDDALRQTPTVLYVGEVRRLTEWKSILRFAGSGHICVTTTHAGSLVEAMRNLMEACSVRTPDQRSSLVNRLLAVVHLKATEVASPESTGKPIRCIIPALWRKSDRSVSSFVSDGLASILPHRSAAGSPGWRGCLGRRYFADRLVELRGPKPGKAPRYDAVFEKLKMQAVAWDLKGE